MIITHPETKQNRTVHQQNLRYFQSLDPRPYLLKLVKFLSKKLIVTKLGIPSSLRQWFSTSGMRIPEGYGKTS
jgi:hypothetical protein